MENSVEITKNIINTINTIFENLFSSIDMNLYEILDELVFINKKILTDKYFEKLLGTSTQSGILLIANSLIIGLILYYSAKLLMSNFTYNEIENPSKFFLKCVIFGICMNCSFFIIEEILNLNFIFSELIRSLGEELFNKNVSFAGLINEINGNIMSNKENLDVFTLDGLIKGTMTISLLNLVFSYSLRYVLIKILVLIAPFAFLSLTIESISFFFKAWLKNMLSLLFIQNFVAIVLLLLFSMDFLDGNLINKFVYIGGIYSLIRANSIVRELFGGISTSVQSGISLLKSAGGRN